ncbi:MAG: FtsX-like permease family protein [Pyrinomonadaceae bacterium]|nr:FtsX-like permease family protein [Pyrinomonadaceae bacterium]
MEFVLNLTKREIRSSWKRLLFFFLCIAIGVGSIVALRSLIQNLGHAVAGDARALLNADIVIDSNNVFSPSEIARIENVIEQSSIVEARNELVEATAMARPVDADNESVEFVAIKAVEPPYPLVGEFVMPGGKNFDFELLKNRGAVVAPILLEELKIKIGDKISIADAEFVVTGTFDEEPGGSGGLRLGARVFVLKTAFEAAGFERNRSRIRRRILYRTSANPTPLVEQLREALRGTPVRVLSYRETQERLGEQFERTENYFSLTGLLILVLGGVGVWNVARVFVEQKRKAVAVLKCLGASGNMIMLAYLLQIGVLGFLGSAFGVFLAQLGLWWARAEFNDALPDAMSYLVPPLIGLQGILLGVFISLLFSTMSLLQVRNIKPRLLLHDDNNDKLRRLDPVKAIVGLLCVLMLLALASWQAGSFRVGAFFLVGIAVTSACLYAASFLLVWFLRKIRKFGSFSISQALNSLHRPGNQTKVILLAVGLGVFVVLAVQSLQTNLQREFDFSRNEKLPSFFFFDIQRSQVEGFEKLVKTAIGEEAEIIPTVRARISHINGKAFAYDDREVRQQQGRIGREFAVTYRPDLDEGENVVDGLWWDKAPKGLPQVSVMDSMARPLKVKPGDSITFDISGRKLTAQVANIRKLDIRNSRTNFLFVFRPGYLETAPTSYAANILKRLPAKQRQALQRDVLERYPNVQIVDVAEIVAVVKQLVENFVLAISFVGSFVILSGILILIGSVTLTKSQRVYENAVLKTLGAKRRTLTTILVAEYSILGTMAGAIGALFAWLLSYAVSVQILKIDWEGSPWLLLTGIGITILLVTLCGTIASFDVLLRKPLGTLRSQ